MVLEVGLYHYVYEWVWGLLQQLVVLHVTVTLDVTELHCTPVIQGHSLQAIGKGFRE